MLSCSFFEGIYSEGGLQWIHVQGRGQAQTLCEGPPTATTVHGLGPVLLGHAEEKGGAELPAVRPHVFLLCFGAVWLPTAPLCAAAGPGTGILIIPCTRVLHEGSPRACSAWTPAISSRCSSGISPCRAQPLVVGNPLLLSSASRHPPLMGY